jgi:DNA-binding SARP family transcriptional activator/ActR/RegA family two-component response regulator
MLGEKTMDEHQYRQVLVVEDRADWQDILSTTLKQSGCTPHSAFSYQEALEALQAKIFSLAVIDPVLDMANRFNRDGLSVIQKIREFQPATPVIILTGSLTHDMEVSLQHLYPNAPILFKESWNAAEFNNLVDELTRQQKQGEATKPQQSLPASVKAPLKPPPMETAIGRPRILLVENRQDWQNIVAAVLDEADYFWRVARNAQEALAELEKEWFHLVILDLKLQQTDLPLRSNEGWLLLDYLVEKHPKTRIVILSGKAGPGDVAHLLTHYPVIGFIEKQNFTPGQIKEAVIQAARSPSLRIQTFGQFQIWRDGQAIGVWEQPQAEMVVKLLLARRARGGRAMAADEMISRLWPDANEESGRKQLLPLISHARRILEPDIESHDSNFILRSANGYYFDIGESVSWDLLEFRDYLELGSKLIEQADWAEAITQLEKGRGLYRGDFLAEDRYADWVMDIRREITTDYCNLLMELADAYAALENYTAAIKSCEDALAKDPLLENVYRRLMQFHYCNGDKGQALKVYRNCIKLFEELFGESPTPATRQLYEAITKDEPLDCPPIRKK